ncbi:DEAD-box ATP-dependent RNA helicase 22 [Cucurbita pepo subsp. pepo]|uniref:DEAD-box ATP-dependent RNA helicase 22 n=1 Tax=Cucurbita pepo subsp. pepo TaxID=3664 RepID=UPI000C9DA532|nr:DEAD-box ATP-dependent RNA helicase 22 [Cucurbita pepo subsp. pepo]
MLLYRSASALYLERLASSSKLLFSFKNSNLLVPSSCSIRIGLVCLRQPCSKQSRAVGTVAASAATPVADGIGRDTFYAAEGVSWTSLGVSDNVSRALVSAGIQRPSLIQAACVPSIMSGNDVVIAAETGSGKTHGYLVPLINKICNEQRDDKLTDGDQDLASINKLSLVLCPNVMLCEQVVQMANTLCDEHGKSLLRVTTVCGRQGWPVYKPDIIVSTPAALLNYIEPNRSRRMKFLCAVKHVVFDEADMLLVGSFQNKVIRLINLLRFEEKLLSRSKESPERLMELEADPSSQLTLQDESDIETETISEGEGEGEGEESYDEDVDSNNIQEKTEYSSRRVKDWRRAQKSYERSKQYIFVAATLPVNGKKTAGAVLRKMFPDASWVSGKYLHCHSPRLEQRWVEVTVDNQVDELIKAVNQSKSQLRNIDGSAIRTMVFANTVETVEAVANILSVAGTECFRYHKDRSLEERSKILADFRENGGVLVCTDAAARGVDIPNVAHVIQADFATSAVDFLHRIGRTGRAGQCGLVTSMYTKANRDLVAAVRRAENLSQPVEAAFSRKRSFRNKLKKQGSAKESVLS